MSPAYRPLRDTINLTTAQTKTLQIGSRALPLNAARLEKHSEPIPRPKQKTCSHVHAKNKTLVFAPGGRARTGPERTGPDRNGPEHNWTFGALATESTSPRGHTQLRSHARTKRNDFPVGLPPQPPYHPQGGLIGIYRRLGCVCPTGKSFRFVRACGRGEARRSCVSAMCHL